MRCSKRWVLPDHSFICHSLFGSDRWWKDYHVSTMVERFEKWSGCAVSCMLEGDLMVGWCSTTDSSDGAAAFGQHCMDALAVLEGDGVYVVHGRVALDTVTWSNGFAVLRDIANQEPAYGRVVSTMSGLSTVSSHPRYGQGDAHVVVQTIGFEVAASRCCWTHCAPASTTSIAKPRARAIGHQTANPVQPTGQSDTNGRRRL